MNPRPVDLNKMAATSAAIVTDASALYETIVYDSLANSIERIAGQFARWLTQRSMLIPEKPMHILDLGAWAGWHSIYLYQELRTSYRRTRDTIHLVDQKDSSAFDRLWRAVCPSQDVTQSCYTQADVFDYLTQSRDRVEQASLIFVCFLVHHLGSKGQHFLRELTRITHEGAIVVLCELLGDHAGWGLSFDKLPYLPLEVSAGKRRTFLRVLKTLSEATERSGWFYYKNPNASRTEATVTALESLGWVLRTESTGSSEPQICSEYEAAFQLGDLTRSSHFFSAFPAEAEDRKRVLDQIGNLGLPDNTELASRNRLLYRVLQKTK